ncbi:hypothetical protein NT05LI_1911, partial [Listeria ivanovii FSL F6-596]
DEKSIIRGTTFLPTEKMQALHCFNDRENLPVIPY